MSRSEFVQTGDGLLRQQVLGQPFVTVLGRGCPVKGGHRHDLKRIGKDLGKLFHLLNQEAVFESRNYAISVQDKGFIVLESSLELYKLDNFVYPSSGQGLSALVTKPSGDGGKNWRDGGYIKKLNKDPWGNEYRYAYPGSNSEFDVFSLGSDAAVGGEGDAADIGNWNLDS